MKTYRIESSAGVQMGEYRGETPEEAIRAMNSDAGEAHLDRNDGLVVVELARSLDDARAVLESEGLEQDDEWYGEDDADEDRLGCTVAEHRDWLCTAPESELRSWARSVANE